MTRSKDSTTGCGEALVVFAASIFMLTVFIIVAGWVFSIAWNAFVVPVFSLPPLDIGQGFAALFIVWAVGKAIGFVRHSSKAA